MKKLEFPILLTITLIALGAIVYGRMTKTHPIDAPPLALEQTVSMRSQELFVVPDQTATRLIVAENGEPIPTPIMATTASLSEPLPTPLPAEPGLVAIKPVAEHLPKAPRPLQ